MSYKPRNSEVDVYAFIKEYLGIQGWKVKNLTEFLLGKFMRKQDALTILK